MNIILFFLLFSDVFSSEYPCQGNEVSHQESSWSHTEIFCHNSLPTEVKKYFKKNDAMMSHEFFNKEGQPIEKRNFNLEGELTGWSGKEWTSVNEYIDFRYYLSAPQKIITSKSLYQISEAGDKTLKKRWNYKKATELPLISYSVESIDTYNERGQIFSRTLVDSPYGLENFTFVFQQPQIKNKFDFVDGVVIKDDSGNLVGAFDVEIDSPRELIFDSMAGDPQKTAIFESNDRRKVGIIDTGFSFSHPDINYKLEESGLEPIDGVDNDGNGIVDDAFGFYVDDDGNLSSNINERIFVKAMGRMPFPFSHGAHVTSIALNNIDSFSWNGFGGDMSNVTFLNLVNERVKKSKIEFINMSFGFGDKRSPVAPNGYAFKALGKLISDNDDVLFFVAAGNEASDIDGKFKQYPASFEYRNILTVGALNTDTIDWTAPLNPKELELASFSNSGIQNVDIFAPGARVLGANVGQLTIPASGTSMASPYALNKVLKIADQYPHLSPMALKTIVLFSAYIPDIDSPLPCASGGVLFEDRARLMASLITDRDTSVEDMLGLGLKVRLLMPVAGEEQNLEYQEKLETLWRQRLVPTLN